MSLVVALYAIRVRLLCPVPRVTPLTPPINQLSAKSEADDRYTYGWHRAEILAALVNGVFLLALCFSVSLEALGRFFSAPGKLKLNVRRGCADTFHSLQKSPTQNWL
jgi:divalent metal cation (Fe/Co/Zn/Cd) transporter